MKMNSKDITESLSALASRVNTYTIAKYASISLFFGAGVSAILIIASRFTPLPFIIAIILSIVLSLMIGLLMGFTRRISLLDSARLADSRLNLGDRLASAVELINENIKPSAMSQLQLDDASRHARNFDPKLVSPHIVPLTAKLLPVAIIALFSLTFIPLQYGESKEVRLAIRQTGKEMEKSAKEIDKSELSPNASKLVSEVEETGRNMQENKLNSKEAMSKISDLNLRVEAMKSVNELSKNLKGEITAEKRLLLNELLEKLSDNIRDFPDMSDLAQKINNAQQTDLSSEAIKELIRALDERKLASTDMRALQQLSSQLSDRKKEITTAFRTRSTSGQSENPDQKGIASSGEGAPSNESIETSDTEPSQRLNVEGKSQEELDGKVSQQGSVVTAESLKEPEKGTSVVPYENIYFEYRESADDAIAGSAIPIVYKEQVKRYFDAIKPQENN